MRKIKRTEKREIKINEKKEIKITRKPSDEKLSAARLATILLSTVIDFSSKCKKLKKHYVSKRKNDLERYKYSWYKLGGINERI